MKYAIINAETNDFYADPTYESRDEALSKIADLIKYRREHGMKPVYYRIELLSKKREQEHEAAWSRFVAAMD